MESSISTKITYSFFLWFTITTTTTFFTPPPLPFLLFLATFLPFRWSHGSFVSKTFPHDFHLTIERVTMDVIKFFDHAISLLKCNAQFSILVVFNLIKFLGAAKGATQRVPRNLGIFTSLRVLWDAEFAVWATFTISLRL